MSPETVGIHMLHGGGRTRPWPSPIDFEESQYGRRNEQDMRPPPGANVERERSAGWLRRRRSVYIVQKYSLPAIASAHKVVHCPWILNANLPSPIRVDYRANEAVALR